MSVPAPRRPSWPVVSLWGSPEDRDSPLGHCLMMIPTHRLLELIFLNPEKGQFSSPTSLVFNSLPFLPLELKHSSSNPTHIHTHTTTKIFSAEEFHTHFPVLETSERSLWPSSDHSPKPVDPFFLQSLLVFFPWALFPPRLWS